MATSCTGPLISRETLRQKPGGKSLVQTPAAFGVRCLYQQARRGFP